MAQNSAIPIGWMQKVNDFLGVNLFTIKPQTLPGESQFVQPGESIFSPVTVAQPAVYPDNKTADYIQKGFCDNGSVYTIISKVASKFGSIPRYAYQIQDKKSEREIKALVKQKGFKLVQFKELHTKAYDEQIVENPFSEILQTPNPMEGQDEFYEKACVFKMATGNCFVWLNRGNIKGLDDATADKRPPLEMWIIPTQYVEILPDPSNVFGVLGYIFQVNGVRWKIRKQDMVHWKSPQPLFDGVTRVHLFGLSPLRPGNKWLVEDEFGTDSTVSAYQNDGAKGVLYQKATVSGLTPNNDPIQQQKIDQVVNRKINGKDMRGAVVALAGTWDYANVAQTGQEMERMDGRDRTFNRLCNLFGVPVMLFQSNTTFANVEQAEKALVTNLVAPMCASFRDALNAKLLPAFGLGKNYTHDIDISQLPELQTEMTQLATTLNLCWWWTPNQKLKAQNMEESTDPNMNKVWVPTTVTLMDDAALNNQIDSFNGNDPTNPGATGRNLPNSSEGDTGAGN